MLKKIAFVGVPKKNIITKLNSTYSNIEWIDLDTPIEYIHKKDAVKFIPETTCSIIQTILTNILKIKVDIFVASIGPCKCDAMRFLIPTIKNLLPNIEIIESINNEQESYGAPISSSNLPLIEKFRKITNNVITKIIDENKEDEKHKQIKANAGFWGVPPYDFSILELFPNTTHVYGWTRCMENQTPDNLELELFIDKNVPTIFYSQSFCAKNILAKELARKHKGLYVEVDGLADNSTRSKIKAYLELNNCY